LLKALAVLVSVVFLAVVVAGAGALYVFWRFGQELPDYRQLAVYDPPVMTRVHAGDGSLMAEYARERRLFVPIAAIPRQVVQAFLSAEDKTFYSHPGVDVFGIANAVLHNVKNLGRNRRPVGASTITQQVAKNFLLSNEVSLERKIKEAILAFRIEHAFSKDRILELYLNEIYLGFGSYGVAAAALNYFNKSLDELELHEAAYLAALPKAPNNYHPVRRHEAAVARRNWVLGRMTEDGAITAAAAKFAQTRDLLIHAPDPTRIVEAGHFAEEVRRELRDRFGEDRLYGGGLSVRTTLEPELQAIAEDALREGLEDFDRRKGWRGAVTRISTDGDWSGMLAKVEEPALFGDWRLAVVLAVHDESANIGFYDGALGRIPLAEMKWARRLEKDDARGPRVKQAGDVVSVGDVVIVAPARAADGAPTGDYALRQVPEADGAVVAMDPHTGRVLAMVGGFSFAASEFNRATQALRQPGSAFKPIVYAAALDQGFTPSSLVLDAPFVIDLGTQGRWKPANYTKVFYGPSTLRLGIEKSRNLMTVRLANFIGMDIVADYASRFGVSDDLPKLLPMSLGAGETTLLRLVGAYSVLVNGGKGVTPTLIDRVQDRRGFTVFRHDDRACEGCIATSWRDQPEPDIPDTRPRIINAGTAYQVVSMLEGVVQRGTGRRIASIGKPLAGKTGTTNDARDTWFIGFSPDLAVGVYVGYDTPRSLGGHESGSSVAAPVFKAFMERALSGKPGVPFRVPPGIQLVRVDPVSGLPAAPGADRTILEAFKPGNIPAASGPVLDGSVAALARDGAARAGTGGLY
jgi:penicillin-binding protein 1A